MLRSELQSGQPVIFNVWVGFTRADWKMVSDAMWFEFTQPGFGHVWEWPLSHTVFKALACQTCPSKCGPTISWKTVGNFDTFNPLCYNLTLCWLSPLILSAISKHETCTEPFQTCSRSSGWKQNHMFLTFQPEAISLLQQMRLTRLHCHSFHCVISHWCIWMYQSI